MSRYCSVPLCNSWEKKHPELSFHLFPKPGQRKVYIEIKFGTKSLVDHQKAWILKLKIGKPITKFMRVCSLHFVESDYFNKGENICKKKMLKKTAVPSQKLPMQSVHVSSHSSRTAERLKKRDAMKEKVLNEQEIPGEVEENPVECEENKEPSHSQDNIDAAEGLLLILQSQPNYTGPKQFRDFQAQVNVPKVLTLCDLMTTDSALNSFTGISSFNILNTIVDAVQIVYSDIRSHRLNIKERIVLVFTKLKCDLSYITLSILFNISHELCRTYIFDMLPILGVVLKSCIRFPDSTEIKNNMPKCFEEFQDVRIVLDCTEIHIQRPKCLCCPIKFYSQYKSQETVKFMTGVSPGGIVTFISKPYGGRASDKLIFDQSNLITKLTSSVDAIMVDKGFMIDDTCEIFKIKLIRPPFLKDKKQLSTEEAILNSKIASARVHIERANQRIKVFKILNGKLQWSLMPMINHIFCIACAVMNLSSPILADNKFLC